MSLPSEKTKERIGISLLAIILVLSGLLLIKDKSAPTEFKESQKDISHDAGLSSVKAAETSDKTSTQGTKININTASVEDLDSLPGIGEVTATKIIDFRQKNGTFKSLESIKDVNGIGEAKYNAIKDLISI